MCSGNIILGAGVAGLGAAHSLDYDCTIYEASDSAGGLCGCFEIDGFRFDKAVHMSFSREPRVLSITHQTPYYIHRPYPDNLFKGRWIKHPIQNNLSKLDVEDRVQALLSYFSRTKEMKTDSFEEWCLSRYGRWIYDNILSVYNKKYWCCDLKKLGISWIKNRIYQTSEKEILEGSFLDKTRNTYYAQEMIYPRKGGYIHLWDSCIQRSRICFNHRAVALDPVSKQISFTNGDVVPYKNLYTSIPLPELINMFSCEVDKEVLKQAGQLEWTSMGLVSVGFDELIHLPDVWFYIYDNDMGAARAYSPSKKSPANAPKGKSSLQFEFYYHNGVPPDSRQCLEETREFLKKMGWLTHTEFMDFRTEPFANVIMTRNSAICKKAIHDFVHKFGSIYPIGRFGKWDYLWSDEAFLTGMSLGKNDSV